MFLLTSSHTLYITADDYVLSLVKAHITDDGQYLLLAALVNSQYITALM